MVGLSQVKHSERLPRCGVQVLESLYKVGAPHRRVNSATFLISWPLKWRFDISNLGQSRGSRAPPPPFSSQDLLNIDVSDEKVVIFMEGP